MAMTAVASVWETLWNGNSRGTCVWANRGNTGTRAKDRGQAVDGAVDSWVLDANYPPN